MPYLLQTAVPEEMGRERTEGTAVRLSTYILHDGSGMSSGFGNLNRIWAGGGTRGRKEHRVEGGVREQGRAGGDGHESILDGSRQ